MNLRCVWVGENDGYIFYELHNAQDRRSVYRPPLGTMQVSKETLDTQVTWKYPPTAWRGEGKAS